jgi:NAD(P)-dependent dehydrogenase (short-subunit alcohol dehydrogenase family)
VSASGPPARPAQAARTVLLVGATQGLGLGLAAKYLREDWNVIATTVVPSPALEALQSGATRRTGQLRIRALDITDRAAVQALAAELRDETLQLLHIVAGVFQASLAPIWEQPDEEILRLLHTNAIGGIRLAELLADRIAAGGSFVFTSSGMGSFARNDKGDVDLYRISKVALNMLVRSFAARRPGRARVLLLCPGWAKTAMGGPDATVEVATSVDGMYDVITQRPEVGRNGAEFFEYSGDVVPW